MASTNQINDANSRSPVSDRNLVGNVYKVALNMGLFFMFWITIRVYENKTREISLLWSKFHSIWRTSKTVS